MKEIYSNILPETEIEADRPGILYAVEELSKFYDNTSEFHHEAIKRGIIDQKNDQEKVMLLKRKDLVDRIPIGPVTLSVDKDTYIPVIDMEFGTEDYLDECYATFLSTIRYIEDFNLLFL